MLGDRALYSFVNVMHVSRRCPLRVAFNLVLRLVERQKKKKEKRKKKKRKTKSVIVSGAGVVIGSSNQRFRKIVTNLRLASQIHEIAHKRSR